LMLSGQSGTKDPLSGQQGSRSEDQKYAGLWVGSYSGEGGSSGDLSFNISRDEKGQWRGTVKYTNQDGQQSAEFKSLQITNGKLKATIDTPAGDVDVTIDGQFQGDKLEGSYAISPKGSTEATEKGTWKLTKGTAAKKEK